MRELRRANEILGKASALFPGRSMTGRPEPAGTHPVQGRGTIRVGTRERLSTLFATPPRKVWLSPFSCAPITMRSHPNLTDVLRISSAG